MKILQITSKSPWPPTTGEAVAILAHAKGFFLLGHAVQVLAMNWPDNRLSLADIPEYLSKDIDIQLVNVSYSKSPYMWAGRSLFNVTLPDIGPRMAYCRELTNVLQNGEFDVIQLEGLYLCPYIRLIRKHAKNALIVLRAHNIEYVMWRREARRSGVFRWLFLQRFAFLLKRLGRKFVNDYDALVTITEQDGLIYDKLGNIRPRFTSPAGIDLSEWVPSTKNLEHPSLFHIGPLDWPPNREGLVWFLNNCWPEIHAKYPAMKFYIAGRKAPARLRRQYENLAVEFLGEVSDARHFMNSKSIMVVPLHAEGGMRVKIIEAMALGKAIVSTPSAATGIPVQDNENILLADTSKDFSAAIIRLLNDKILYDKLCKNSINFIREKYNNANVIGELIKFYKEQIRLKTQAK
ncbi:MAG: glycosyltransferase family 4 protein [Bacteroidales bacterium]|jgi:glycosyltransferase involved in cell wall biosynthesis|nr:glycosyltransferase family 4 protein [Bacteroidales bacterium]